MYFPLEKHMHIYNSYLDMHKEELHHLWSYNKD